jgi:hypothetical protein
MGWCRRKDRPEVDGINYGCSKRDEVDQQKDNVFLCIEIAPQKQYAENADNDQNKELSLEETFDLSCKEGVEMPHILPEYDQEKDEDQGEADHQERGRNEFYLEISSGNELNDKEEDDAQESHDDPVDHRVKKCQLTEKEKVEFKIDIQVHNEKGEKTAEEKTTQERIDEDF